MVRIIHSQKSRNKIYIIETLIVPTCWYLDIFEKEMYGETRPDILNRVILTIN